VGYRFASPDRLEYAERPPKPGELPRRAADLTTALELKQSRARLWRYPPHSTGRRHRDHVQEEVFVVVSGTLTMLLGDAPERVDVGPGGVVAVEPMTPLQMRNETDEELVVFVYGAPPLQEGADFLDDVPLPEPGSP
jgi:mannose-6-phosphate isomerase-like protein (cupin superfamily)